MKRRMMIPLLLVLLLTAVAIPGAAQAPEDMDWRDMKRRLPITGETTYEAYALPLPAPPYTRHPLTD